MAVSKLYGVWRPPSASCDPLTRVWRRLPLPAIHFVLSARLYWALAAASCSPGFTYQGLAAAFHFLRSILSLPQGFIGRWRPPPALCDPLTGVWRPPSISCDPFCAFRKALLGAGGRLFLS